VSQDDPNRMADSEAERTRAEARAAELRAELAETDARRTEEQVTEAHDAVEDARRQEEELSRKEREQRERAEQVQAEARQAREQAEEAARARDATHGGDTGATDSVSGGSVAGPGVGAGTDPKGAAAAGRASSESRPAAIAAETPGAQPAVTDRPEVLLGGAFVGTFVLARILKRLFD
jgi:predicted ribosome quality control (RQC) complex YloA/Tae2 family protein